MAEKSITNAKKPNQVAKTARKLSGSTRKDRKSALKLVAQSTARGVLKSAIAQKERAKAGPTETSPHRFDRTDADKAAMKTEKAALRQWGSQGETVKKAASLGVKPKKIAKTAYRAKKAVNKRMDKAAKVQGVSPLTRKKK
jgi:hypothetical protein